MGYAFWRRGGKTHAELNKDGYHFILLLLSTQYAHCMKIAYLFNVRVFKKLKTLLKGEKPSDLLRNCKCALDSHIFRIESPVVHILPFFALLLSLFQLIRLSDMKYIHYLFLSYFC